MARVVGCKHEERMEAFIYIFLGAQIALKWSLIFDSDRQLLGIVSWIAAMYNLTGWRDVFGEVLKHKSGRE